MNDYPIGETIRTLRTSQGLSQKELGDALDISTQAVSKWETGAAIPDTLMLPQIAAFFGVSVGYLLGQEDPISQVDVAFYGEFLELTEEQKATVRDMVHLMRARRSARETE